MYFSFENHFFLSHLPVENDTISYSLVQERLEQPKEYSENPREGNYKMNKQTREEKCTWDGAQCGIF